MLPGTIVVIRTGLHGNCFQKANTKAEAGGIAQW